MPVVVDGVIAAAAALMASVFAPEVTGYLVAGHRSSEPGSSAALEHLGLSPVLDLGMRLGEGTGAVLAVPTVQAAAKILREMATFDSAGVNHTAWFTTFRRGAEDLIPRIRSVMRARYIA